MNITHPGHRAGRNTMEIKNQYIRFDGQFSSGVDDHVKRNLAQVFLFAGGEADAISPQTFAAWAECDTSLRAGYRDKFILLHAISAHIRISCVWPSRDRACRAARPG